MDIRGITAVGAVLVVLALGGCGEGKTASAKVADALATTPGMTVDSVRSMDEEFRRFTVGLTEPARLSGGEATPEALARRWMAAVAARDTAALRAMHVSRAEFAWLYWKDSHLSKPPYEFPPGIAWLQVEGEGNAGISRALEAYGGKRLTFESMTCGNQRVEGAFRVHQGCDVTFQVDGSRETLRLFGNLLERDGQVKFLSYANDF